MKVIDCNQLKESINRKHAHTNVYACMWQMSMHMCHKHTSDTDINAHVSQMYTCISHKCK